VNVGGRVWPVQWALNIEEHPEQNGHW
jgi:hypothetical protein